MINKIEIGKYYTLLRSAFILKGVIVQHHSSVRVISCDADDTYTGIYTDKEGYEHTLTNLKGDELEAVQKI